MPGQKPHPFAATLSTNRLEAFSDGVFAIAITLLILEVKVLKGWFCRKRND